MPHHPPSPWGRAGSGLESMTIPRGPLRVVGDVHGDARGFAAAAASDRFVVQLRDLTDHGPDSAEALRIMFRLIDEERGLFVLGHRIVGWVMARIYDGAAFLQPLPNPARRAGSSGARPCLSNGGFHPAMLEGAPPPVPLTRPDAILSRALYGEPTGRTQPDGFPERSLRWVDKIPADFNV